MDERASLIRSKKAEFQQLIEKHAKEEHIPGIAFGLVVDNELVATAATGFLDLEQKRPATAQSAFRIASMTKSFTAMAILKLRDEGKLSLTDPVEKYIPAMEKITYPTSDSPLIDIENLLTMTAGFPEDNPWGDRQLDEPDQMLIDLVSEGISFSNVPSLSFEYSNTAYALLGHLVTRISGQPFQTYITEQILKPLKMAHTYWEIDEVPAKDLALGYRWEDDSWKLEPMLHDGSFGAMGGLITTIEDFSKYVSFHLSATPARSGDDNGPVKRSTLREMHTPQFSRLSSEAKDWNDEPCASMVGYGYGLGIQKNCKEITSVSHGGDLPGFGSNYVFFPEYGVGLIDFGNLTYTSPWPLRDLAKILFDSLGLQARQLPISDILAQRQQQVAQMITTWEPWLEENILAENFYLDESRGHRKTKIEALLQKAGPILSTDPIVPENQLRGTFNMITENGMVSVSFTLTPEIDPKVQDLEVRFEPK
ncbi:MAG: class A beta-lactamase-related serine hydrolase [Flavobacteriales bacterium]|nr:MAG: class A beta-lactamase-related serine hydrolase [Flavobacteriales bacterium]